MGYDIHQDIFRGFPLYSYIILNCVMSTADTTPVNQDTC